MQELTDKLKDATKRIPAHYFSVPVAGGSSIYRERVYCYELYHQLRACWPDSAEYFVTGENDKRGHPKLNKLDRRWKTPDLLVHIPGSMGRSNHAIIEVKSSNARKRGIKKDLETLSKFRSEFKYQRGIYLIYGNKANNTATRIMQCVTSISIERDIELWTHCAANEPAELCCYIRRNS